MNKKAKKETPVDKKGGCKRTEVECKIKLRRSDLRGRIVIEITPRKKRKSKK